MTSCMGDLDCNSTVKLFEYFQKWDASFTMDSSRVLLVNSECGMVAEDAIVNDWKDVFEEGDGSSLHFVSPKTLALFWQKGELLLAS